MARTTVGRVRIAVAARLGYEPFLSSADRTIIALVGHERRALRASVQIVDQNGVINGIRRLEARMRRLQSCPCRASVPYR